MSETIYIVCLSFLLSVFFALLLIPFLRKLKFGQSIREVGPSSHLQKAGTPTMGGLIILPAVVITTLFCADFNNNLLLALLLFLGYALIGFVDDYIKVVLKRNLGLTSKEKLLAQLILALVFLYFSYLWDLGLPLTLPVLGIEVELGIFYYPLVILLLLGTTNAVNLTDGLDGLAASATIPVALAYAFISATLGMFSLTVFALALAGACLGFLLFNKKPAKIFMGDTGSLALGGAVAALALLTSTELFLLIIGGLYVIETLSVILQVASFKKFGKRIFRMSPLHHHFELSGWSEQKVVIVFGLASVLFSVSGVYIWLVS